MDYLARLLPARPWYVWLVSSFAIVCAIGIADNFLIKRYRVVELPEESPADEDHA